MSSHASSVTAEQLRFCAALGALGGFAGGLAMSTILLVLSLHKFPANVVAGTVGGSLASVVAELRAQDPSLLAEGDGFVGDLFIGGFVGAASALVAFFLLP